jgi:hypothetical protein
VWQIMAKATTNMNFAGGVGVKEDECCLKRKDVEKADCGGEKNRVDTWQWKKIMQANIFVVMDRRAFVIRHQLPFGLVGCRRPCAKPYSGCSNIAISNQSFLGFFRDRTSNLIIAVFKPRHRPQVIL